MDASRKGKIASLPAQIREEVNQRLHNGEQAPQILPWLNSNADVLRVLDDRWGEEPVTANNLSEWRRGGFKDWLARNDRVHAIRTLSGYSLELAKASGGNISEGAAAVAGGRILELIERAADAEGAATDKDGNPVFELGTLIESLVSLRSAEIQQKRTDQRDIVLQQRDRQLALEETKFRRQTAELFLEFYEDEKAREIAESNRPPDVKVQDMVQVMFGEAPG
jgi:hypothetical protein